MSLIKIDHHRDFGMRSQQKAGTTRCVSGVCILHRRQYLSRIENILRVERRLQRAHGVDRLNPEFGLEIFLLALPDAVLAGAGSAHRLRALDQAMHEVLAARHLVVIVDVA
jgi:hypothetical protein